MPRFAMQISSAFVVATLATALLCGCKKPVSDRPIGTLVQIKAPLGLPPVPIPADNPPTIETIALGRILFYDKHLSKDDTIACATCHDPRYSFTDGQKISHGVGGALGVRNAPTIANAVYLPFQFWDGRAATLESQAISPIANPIEMSQPHEVFVTKLNDDPVYRKLFNHAFGPGGVTPGRLENALASFERTVLIGNSAFDRYQYGGDHSALTPTQVRGFAVYINPMKGNCGACHTITSENALFTDGKFHNTGEGVDGEGKFTDVGRFHETKVATDEGAFKTPTLRNIALTAPYMHDGSIKTLKEVIDFYAGGGNSNPNLDPEMKKIHLTGQDRADLVEFLQSLTSDLPPNVGPPQK